MIGKTISHYKILEKLGEGGMGVVYKAEDTKLKRTVALKFLPPELIRNSEAKERFIHESQTAAALNHPNICTIHEIDESESPTGVGRQSFIAMECIEGQSLKEKIESGPIKFEEALAIIGQVAEGLREAHDRGIVHRDIKSTNIMVTSKGQAKIMDFGLAKLAGQTKLTKAGTTLGTVAYMSPEQARGGRVDFRTDIWSLGVVFYEMLTGELPFRGEYEQAVIYSILNVDPDPIAGIPLECERIVNSCLRKDSEARYPSTADLQADLKLLEQETSSGKVPIRKKTTAAPGPLPKLLRKPAVLIGGVILALLLLFFLSSGRRIVKKWLGTEVKNLAMLPFTVMVGDSTDQAFCDGMVESLTDKLTQLEQFESSLWVVPSLDVRNGEITSVNEAKRSMSGVNLVITGSFRRMGDMIVLKMNLIDTKTLRQQNSLEIRDHIANISTWQDDVAIKLINLLDIELKPEMRRVLTSSGTSISDAYGCYLQGLGYLQNEEKEGSLDAAIRMFERAIEKDSLYALAYAGLGKAYWLKYKLTKIDHWVEKARTNCNRTIQIDNRLVPVRITLGDIYKETGRYVEAIEEYQQALQVDPVNSIAYLDLAAAYEEIEKLTEAEEIYKKVIELRPSYSIGYNCLGYYYWRYGHLFEAEKMFLKATELAPEQIMIYNNLGAIYFLSDRSDLAMDMLEKSVAIKPNPDACSNLGTLYFFNGRYADAMAMYEQAIKFEEGKNSHTIWANLADAYRYTPGYSEKAPDAYQRAIQLTEDQLVINPNDAHLRSSLAVFYAKSANSRNALAEISKARKLTPNDVTVLRQCVLVFELANQRDEAIRILRDYIDRDGSLEEIDNDPDLAGLRLDPRYRELISNKE